MRAFCLFALIPLAGTAAYVLWKDFVAAAFILASLAVIAILLRLLRTERPGRFRWIDFSTPNSEFDFGPSEASKVETAIAQREKRITELEREMSK